jgi:drug/metabolite transporter (DMT)-like permease
VNLAPETAIALPLALAGSISNGVSDFAGAVASRHNRVLEVVAMAMPASWAVVLILLPVVGARFSGPAVMWGAASGLASCAAFLLLYRCLAIGPIGLLSPLAAVVSATLPVLVGLGQGERIRTTAAAGIGCGLLAIALTSTPPGASASRRTPDRAVDPPRDSRPGRRRLPAGVVTSVGAGVAIAMQLLCLQQAPAGSGLAPLVAAGAASTGAVLAATVVARCRPVVTRGTDWLALVAGLLGSLANVAVLGAVRHGTLTGVAVVTSLYPASTVLLASTVLRERLSRPQSVGLVLAAGSVIALSLG